jgi:nitrite reductase/ring-hydroxylating ferredoxin subunit
MLFAKAACRSYQSLRLLGGFRRSFGSELKLGSEGEFAEGVMKTVEIDKDKSVVAAKVDGKIYAVSGKCTHWGAPMGQGYLDGHEVLCPWHIAPFDIRSGASLQGPGIAPLLSFPVSVRSGEVYADIAVPTATAQRVEVTDPRKFVILGGGAAGQACAETLRKSGFKGHITILSQSNHLPVDTPTLSKAILTDPAHLTLRPQGFYDQQSIEIKLAHQVTRVEQERKLVHCENGSQFGYDKLFIATGAKPNVPKPFEQAYSTIKGVFTLREADQTAPFQAHLKSSSSVVILGGSFLGMEYATSLRRALPQVSVTVVELEDIPMARIFGSEIGQQLLQ